MLWSPVDTLGFVYTLKVMPKAAQCALAEASRFSSWLIGSQRAAFAN